MKAGRSISLDSQVWNDLETYMMQNNQTNVSEVIEEILSKFFEKVKKNG